MAYDNEQPNNYLIIGSKGKGGGSSASSASEAPNTIQSFAVAKIMDLISSGEIEGWADADPLKCVFLDNTPVKNPDGSVNYQGIKMDWRVGTPDQDHISGYDDQGSTVGVEIKATTSIYPIYTVTNPSTDAVSVGVAIPALSTTDTSTGDTNGGTVTYAIDVRQGGSSTWVEKLNKTMSEKFTSVLQIAHRIDIRGLTFPVSLRLRRITADSTELTVQNETYFAFATELVEAKLTYPNSAVVGLTAEAKQFGDRVPGRSYRIKGLKCLIPNNYDPVTRNYSGIWDGTLKIGWTRNPAWVLFSILVNKDWGMGDLIDIEDIDRYSLYEIAQYCDAEVPDGYGGMEPRYQFDAYIQTREEAAKAIQAIASTFQGMVFATSAKVLFSQDAPKTVKRLVTNANVIGGSFVYEGFSRESKNSVAVVTWNDPEQLGKPAAEVVEDPDLIDSIGWKPTDVFAYGCSSRGQARRVGKWVLFSSKYETRTCSFRASLDFADVLPGHVLRIADQHRQGIRAGGRLKSIASTSAVLDTPFEFKPAVSYTIWVTKADGTLDSRVLTMGSGTTANVTWSGTLSGLTPQEDSVYIITSTEFSPPLYKVLSIRELSGREPHVEIVCVRHYEEKFDFIEYDIPFDATGETIYGLSGVIGPPTNPVVRRTQNILPGGLQEFLEVSFTRSTNKFVFEYPYRWRFRKGTWEEGKTASDNFTIPFRGDGYYDFVITARGPNNRESIPLAFTSDGNGNIRPIDDPFIRNLRIAGNTPTDLIFGGRVLKVEWDVGAPIGFEDSDDWVDPYFRDFEITIQDASDDSILRHYYTTDNRFEYTAEMVFEDNDGVMIRDIKVTVAMRDKHDDILGSSTKTFSNPPPGLPADIIVTSRIGGANVVVKPPVDRDIKELVVWLSTDSLISITEDPWLRTSQYSFEIDRPNGAVYWIVMAFTDDWFQSIDELNVTVPIMIAPRSILLNDLDQTIRDILADVELMVGEGNSLTERLRTLRFDIDETANAIITNALRDVTTQAYIDAKTHLDGVEIGTVLVQEKNERIEEDTAIAELISLIGAKSGDGLAFIMDTSTVKVSPTESLAERLTFIETSLGEDIQAQILTETNARVAADSALASSITSLGVQLDDAEAAIVTEATTRATAISAEATARQNLAAQIEDDISAAVLTETNARVTADNSLANIISKIGALNGDGSAFVFDTSTAQVGGGVALATRLTGIDTSIGSVNTSIANEVVARQNAISAEASARSVLQTTVNGHTSSITSIQSSVNGVLAKAGVLLNVNNHVIGWTANNNGSQGWFSILADQFIIVDPANQGSGYQAPFEVSGGVVRIPYAEVGVVKARVTIDGSYDYNGSVGADLGSDQQVAVAGYTFPFTCTAQITGHLAFSNFNNQQIYVRATLRKNGGNIYEVSSYAYLLNPGYITLIWYDTASAGYHWYDIIAHAYDTTGSSIGSVTVGSSSLNVEAKLNWK